MTMKNRITGPAILFVMIMVISALIPIGALAQPMNTNEIVVELNDDYFNPDEITIPVVETTKLILKNKGEKEHTFTVKKLGIDVEVQPGKEKTITLKPKEPGTYELLCRYHANEGMVGKVIVK